MTLGIGIRYVDKISIMVNGLSVLAVFILVPIWAFITGVFRAKKLTQLPSYSVAYWIYRICFNLFIFSFLSTSLLWALDKWVAKGLDVISSFNFFHFAPYYSFADVAILFVGIFIIVCVFTSVAFMFFVRKDFRIIKIVFSFLLVIPAIVTFFGVLILKAFPSFRKYAPTKD